MPHGVEILPGSREQLWTLFRSGMAMQAAAALGACPTKRRDVGLQAVEVCFLRLHVPADRGVPIDV
jgi:hypothetical protein